MNVFHSKKQLKAFVCAKSVADKKPFRVLKSDSIKYVVVCTVEGCKFHMSLAKNVDDIFHLVHAEKHDCDSVLPTIKRSWVSEQAAALLEDNKRLTVGDLKDFLRVTFGVTPDGVLLANALTDAKRLLAKVKPPFGLVSSFLGALALQNEGTTTCTVIVNGVFARAFLCPSICANAFPHTTMVVGLDACHLKSRYAGVLLVMTVLDGNGQIFPMAVAVAEGENEDTWTWFLALVCSALNIDNDNGGDGMVVLSDREKGLANAVKTLLPRAAHSPCVFHIQKNVKARFKTALNGLLFKAAKAADHNAFLDAMAEMRRLHGAAGGGREG